MEYEILIMVEERLGVQRTKWDRHLARVVLKQCHMHRCQKEGTTCVTVVQEEHKKLLDFLQ